MEQVYKMLQPIPPNNQYLQITDIGYGHMLTTLDNILNRTKHDVRHQRFMQNIILSEDNNNLRYIQTT